MHAPLAGDHWPRHISAKGQHDQSSAQEGLMAWNCICVQHAWHRSYEHLDIIEYCFFMRQFQLPNL
jgi:hypothetical protein